MLSSAARRARLAGAGIFLALTLAGTAWGDDDHWPFAPFRMYSTTTRPDGGTVIVPTFEGVTEDGRRIEIGTDEVGLRRAEILGQLKRLRARPELLGALAVARARLDPGAPKLRELQLVAHGHRLRGGRAVAVERSVLASWRAPEPTP